MIPQIFISRQVIHDIRVLEQIGHDCEWSAELWGSSGDDQVRVESLLLNKQVVNPVSVNGMVDSHKRSSFRHKTLFYHHRKGRLKGKTLVGWIHSHVYAAAFLSATDRTQVRQYLTEIDLLISIVVTREILQKNKRVRYGLKLGIWLDGTLNTVRFIRFRTNEYVVYEKTWFEDDISVDEYQGILEDYRQLVQVRAVNSGIDSFPGEM